MLTARAINHAVRDKSGEVAVQFRNLHFSLAPGEIVGLLGSSGCGKTTLVRMLAGFVKPSEGSVLCNGEPVRQPVSPVATVSQDYRSAVFPWMTVRENLALGLRKNPNGSSPSLLEETARRLDVAHLLGRYPGTLSGGERQRVQVGRALLMRAQYLLLDEPSSSLDLELRKTLLELLGDIVARYGCGILLVTHNIDEAVFVCDRLYLGRKGVDQVLRIKERVGFCRLVEDLGVAHRDLGYQDTYSEVYHELFAKQA